MHIHTTHAHYSHHPCTNKLIATLRSEDRVLLEITEIHIFRRRRARHDHIVASQLIYVLLKNRDNHVRNTLAALQIQGVFPWKYVTWWIYQYPPCLSIYITFNSWWSKLKKFKVKTKEEKGVLLVCFFENTGGARAPTGILLKEV